MDSNDQMRKYVGHLAVMLNGTADITETGDKFDVRIEANVNTIMPTVFTIGVDHDTPPTEEIKLMFLLGVIREWHRKVEQLVRVKCKNLTISDAVDLGDGQTGLVGDGGAKA